MWKLISGCILFVIGFLGGVPVVIYLISQIMSNNDLGCGVVPGKFSFKVEQAGDYMIWNNFQGIYKGQSFNCSESLPDGWDIKVINQNGKDVTLKPVSHFTTEIGGTKKASLAEINAVPGDYVLMVAAPAKSEKRLLSVSKNIIGTILVWVLGGTTLCFVFSFVGLGLIIWGIVSMIAAKKQVKPPVPPQHL